MSGLGGFTFGARLDRSPPNVSLPSNPQMPNFGALRSAADGGGTFGSPYLLRSHRAIPRKRSGSPESGPAPKRRPPEERMIGDLEKLSLSGRRAGERKCAGPTAGSRAPRTSLERWQELESRLSAEQEEEQEEPTEPRLVMSDELQKLVTSPAPAVVPELKSPDNSKALVLWHPPVVPPLPESPEPSEPSEPADEAVEPLDVDLEVEEAGPLPPSPAYDFSPFFPPPPAAAWPGPGPSDPPRFQFGWDGDPTAAAAANQVHGPFAGFGQQAAPPPSDDSMEL